ncbi:MAG: hypothetical protein AB1757_06675 [Acidobacteriota bacterium]
MERVSNYEADQHRTFPPTAWLDEALQSIELALQDAINEQTVEGKDKVLLGIITYIGGVMDGNRFMRENPYKDKPPLPLEQLRRIHY